MSCCPPSITPDFSDNTGGGGVSGVQSVVAGTNITISGTPTNPQVNALAGVSAVEGLQGSINLVGLGCSINALGQDIIFDVPPSGVQTVSTTGAGLTKTGTATNPILQNTGVVSITTPTANGSGLSITNGGVGAIQMACQVKSGIGCIVRPSTVDATLFVDNNGVNSLTAGTGIQITGSAQNPTISSAVDGVQTITAGTNITLGGTATNPIINSSGSASNRLVVLTSQNLTMPAGATMMNITLVGGGGGGGGGTSFAGGGGGGSGNVYTFNSLTLPVGFSLQFVIGNGGAGGGLTTAGVAGFDTIVYTTFSNPTFNTEIGRARGGLGGGFATSGFSGQAGAGGAGGYGGGGGGCSGGINTNYGAGGVGSQPSQIVFTSSGQTGNNSGGAGGYNNSPQFATLGGGGGSATGGQGTITRNGVLGGGGMGGDGSNLSGAGGNGYAVLEWF